MPTRKNKNITRIVNRVNESSADFVNRLKDPNRLSIPDWEDSRYLATHKLGVGTDDNGQVFIYPSVQNINGKLVDFTNPKFGKWDGMDSAIERKDTVHVYSIQDGLDFTENYKRYYPKGKSFKCGGRRKAQLGLDIQYGGRAIPIGKNMVYFDGNSHENGGIGVGNKLEVEGGEVGEYKNNTLRVFSSVPFLRGFSPAQLVMGGANPNKVFKAQEDFKDKNRINDDGTHYQNGGQTKSNSAIRTEADKKVSARNRAIYSAVDATSDYPKWWQAVGLGIGSNFKTIINPDSMNYTVTDSVADAAWRKRLGLSYNDKFLIPNKDGSVRLPRNVEMEIPTDTTMLKKRIATNEKFANQSNIVGEDWQIVQAMMKKDKEALEALRKTYKTGEPVVINEYAHNTRKLSKNGELIDDAINYKSPLNIMRNYTIQYDPKTKKMNYWDTYDFNEFEWGVPGKPFEIRGSVPLKRYGGSSEDDTKTATLKRLRNKFTIRGDYNDGMFGGAGAGSIIMERPEFITDTITKRYLVPVTQTFNDAFRNARNSGQNEFMFDGKLYNTNLGDNPNNNAAGANRTSTIIIPIEHKEVRRRKKEFGGSMIYTINGNVKNGLMSARPKAQYGLATKYLKKKNKTAEKSVEIKQNDEPKILDIRNTAGYKVKQFAENPWVKYPVEVASYLLTGATAKGMQTGTKMAKKAVNKIDDILGKPRQEYLSRNVSDKTIKVGTIENPIRPKDSSRITKVYKPTVNEISQAKEAAKPKTEPRIKSIDKIYKQVVGNKEPRSTVGNVPQWTEILYTPTNRTITAYDASAEFHKRISDVLYDGLVKKYGKKGVDKAMKREHISKYEYGGRIKAKAGKFLKYKNGVFTDPKTGEEYDVDPEVFKMRGNSFENGIIPVDENYTTSDYYYGSTFDNARPQFYAEKQLPLFGSQSIAEKAGIAKSGWSYSSDYKPDYKNYISDNNSVKGTNNDYVSTTKPNTGESYIINPITGEWIRNGVTETSEPSINGTTKVNSSTSSTPRGRVTKSFKPATSTKPATVEAKQPKLVERPKENLYITGIKNNAVKSPLMTGMEKISANPASSSTGGGTQSKDGNWVPQYNLITGKDLLGVGTNLAGHIASYFANRDILDKYPMPTRPVMTPAVKLKTRVNINPDLTNSKEAELMGIEATNRNTSSSNTTLARNQRIMNEGRDARNKLYAYKENAETQLINQDNLNRQGVYARNVAAYNDWLNKTYVAKTNKLLGKQQVLMNLINGIPMAVNNVLANIETRKSTNDMIQAIAAANPNGDGRLLGIGDYYTQQLGNGKIAKYNKNHKFIKYV